MAKPTDIKATSPYTEEYKEKCKIAWYEAGKPHSMTQLLEKIPNDEFGRKPHRTALMDWRDEEGWDIWADELDVQVELKMEDYLVWQRVLMLKEIAADARVMRKKGIEYIREHEFDSSASAVNAFIQGAKLEKSSRGLSERLEKLLMMDDEELNKEAFKLLEKAKDSGEILDMESEDIEEDDNEQNDS